MKAVWFLLFATISQTLKKVGPSQLLGREVVIFINDGSPLSKRLK